MMKINCWAKGQGSDSASDKSVASVYDILTISKNEQTGPHGMSHIFISL